MSTGKVFVTDIDHIVLRVRNVSRSIEFYRGDLGLTVENEEKSRAGKVRFPSLRVNESTIINLLEYPARDSDESPNLDHFCLTVEPVVWETFVESAGVHVVEGPVQRSGARGQGISIYLEDPDGNSVELRYYPERSRR